MKLDEIVPPGEYWKAPAPKSIGDTSADVIYRAIGEYLSTWENLEQTFAFLFQRFVEGSYAAKRAYGAIMSNNGRRSVLTAAAEVYFTMERPTRDDLQKRFSRLTEHFRQAASRRNDIAHGRVASITFDETYLGFFLMPSEYNSNRTNPYPDVEKAAIDRLSIFGAYRYTSADILEFAERIAVFQGAAMEYALHGWTYDLGFRTKPEEEASIPAQPTWSD